MSRRISAALAIVLVLALVSGAWLSASAEDVEVPFYVYYPVNAKAVFDPDCYCLHQTFEAVGQATHLGRSSFYSTATSMLADPITDPMTQFGDGEITAANGDKLFIHYAGEGVYIPGHGVDFGGTLEIKYGTGRLAGVTGQGRYWGYAYFMVPNPENKPNDLWFEGHLYK